MWLWVLSIKRTPLPGIAKCAASARREKRGADIISEAWIHAGRRPPKEDDGDDEDDDDNDDDNGITRTTMQ